MEGERESKEDNWDGFADGVEGLFIVMNRL